MAILPQWANILYIQPFNFIIFDIIKPTIYEISFVNYFVFTKPPDLGIFLVRIVPRPKI